MPAAISEEIHEKAKVIAIAVGYREAGRQLGISENTILSWARREGWSEQVQVAQQAVLTKHENQGMHSPALKSTSDLLLAVGPKSKLLAAKVGHNTLKAINKEKGQALIACAPAFNSTVKALDTVHNWSEKADNRTLVNINLLNSKLPDA